MEKNWSKPEFEHHFHRRGHNINYYGPGTWHIVIQKTADAPLFGELRGDPSIKPGEKGSAFILWSNLGRIIKMKIEDIQRAFAVFQVYQYMIMPDHIHLLVRLRFRNEKHLGFYIGKLKEMITNAWKQTLGIAEADDLPYQIFKENYTDRIIHSERSLEDVFRYIRENPHRLAMRQLRPDFFQKIRNIEIDGELWQAYGNLFHLRNPFKSAVIVRSHFTEEEKVAMREEWLWNAANGGVLVSPFISPAEKAIRDEAERIGGRIIHIQEKPFEDKFKPESHRFEQCVNGTLLILAPMQPMREERFRHVCQHMNRIAEALCRP